MQEDNKKRSNSWYSHTALGIASIFVLLLFLVLCESVCLGILYVNDRLKSHDISTFAEDHILTRLFVSPPIGPVIPGKHFIGILTRGPRGWAQYTPVDDLLGWRLGSNISTFYSVSASPRYSNGPASSAPRYFYVTDDNGFSVDPDDPPVALEKPTDTYRVVVLGGSTVMGQGAPMPSQNIVSMLRKGALSRGLTGKNAKRIEFINAGVDGYNSAQEYLYFVSDLLRFKPDLVIVYDGWNDVLYTDNNLSLFQSSSHLSNQRALTQSHSLSGSVHLLAGNLMNSLSKGEYRLGMVELALRVLSHTFHNEDIPHSTLAPFNPQSVEYYRIIHKAFLALADEQLSVAEFLQPVVGVDSRELSAEEKKSWWYPLFVEKHGNRVPFYKGARQVLADLTKSNYSNNHICIADLSQSFNGVSDTVHADSGHLLPKGNEIVAKKILDELVSCGLLKERKPDGSR